MNHFEKAMDALDACIFSGDLLFNDQGRAALKANLERWNRAITQHEAFDREVEEGEEE